MSDEIQKGDSVVEESNPQSELSDEQLEVAGGGSDGRTVIDTEIVQLDLTGSSSLGPVQSKTEELKRVDG